MKYKFTNELERVSLYINDSITGDADEWFGGFSLDMLKEKLSEANGKPLDIHINSYGGEVFEGFAIYNAIKEYAGDVVCYVDGIAASIASVIALAGSKLVMHKASMFMIHNASGGCYGTAEEMKQVVEALEKINSVIKDIYLSKVNIDADKLTELMNNETFLTPQECIDYGFCDEIIDDDINEEQKEESLNNYLNKVEERIKELKNVKEALNLIGGAKESVIKEDKAFLNKNERKYAWLRKEFLNEIK